MDLHFNVFKSNNEYFIEFIESVCSDRILLTKEERKFILLFVVHLFILEKKSHMSTFLFLCIFVYL